jgi:hypothetical protein
MKKSEELLRLAIRKELKQIFEGESKDPFVPVYGTGEVVHDCPKHVQEVKSGKKGTVVNHTLNESGEVNFVDVDFGTGKVFENIPTKKLKVLTTSMHEHATKAEPTINEAPMDKRFAKEWEKNSKVLLSHIKHESKKGDRENHRELSKLSNMVQDALSVPNQLARIVGMQEGKLTEGVGGVISRNAFGSLNEGNSYYDLKVQYYEISDNHGNGGLLSTLQDIKKKADTEQMDKIGGIDAEIKIWTAIHKLFNKSKLGKIL